MADFGFSLIKHEGTLKVALGQLLTTSIQLMEGTHYIIYWNAKTLRATIFEGGASETPAPTIQVITSTD